LLCGTAYLTASHIFLRSSSKEASVPHNAGWSDVTAKRCSAKLALYQPHPYRSDLRYTHPGMIEVEDVELKYRQVIEKGLPVQQELTTQAWGHRSFCVREPNGLTLYFFSELQEG
jgi:hypothetical protein